MFSSKKLIGILLVGVVVIGGVMVIQGMVRRTEGPQIALEEGVDPVEIYLYLSQKPLLDKEVRLVTTVIPKRDIETGSVKLTFPEGITVVEKEGLTWEGSIKKDEFIQLPTKVRLTKVGKWKVEVEVKGKGVLKKGSLSIEVTEADVNISSKEAEYILNPLPPDKFVFVEVREENISDAYGGMLLRPFVRFWFDRKNKILQVNDKTKLPDEETLVIIGHIVGYKCRSKKLEGGGGEWFIYKVDGLPYIAKLSQVPYGIRKDFVKDLILLRICQEGGVKIKYGDEEVFLSSEQSWSVSDEKRIELSTQKNVKFINELGVINRGLFQKNLSDKENRRFKKNKKN
jgi:hypothetical protein